MKSILLIFLVFLGFGAPHIPVAGPQATVRVQVSRALHFMENRNFEAFGQLFDTSIYTHASNVFERYSGYDLIIHSASYGIIARGRRDFLKIHGNVQFIADGPRFSPQQWFVTMVSDPTSPTRWKIQRFDPLPHNPYNNGGRKFFYRPNYVWNRGNQGKIIGFY